MPCALQRKCWQCLWCSVYDAAFKVRNCLRLKRESLVGWKSQVGLTAGEKKMGGVRAPRMKHTGDKAPGLRCWACICMTLKGNVSLNFACKLLQSPCPRPGLSNEVEFFCGLPRSPLFGQDIHPLAAVESVATNSQQTLFPENCL